jgi:hypothetical protein
MTKDDILKAIEELKKPLKLESWTIELSDEPADPDTYADVHTVVVRYHATIRIDPEFYKLEPKWKSNTLIHELCHVKQRHLEEVLRNLTRNMSEDMKLAIRDSFYLEMEYITDWQANILMELIPIPRSLIEETEEESVGLTD